MLNSLNAYSKSDIRFKFLQNRFEASLVGHKIFCVSIIDKSKFFIDVVKNTQILNAFSIF